MTWMLVLDIVTALATAPNLLNEPTRNPVTLQAVTA